jgi:hypothetical protein
VLEKRNKIWQIRVELGMGERGRMQDKKNYREPY